MRKYNVKITDSALNDMEKIYDYISNSLFAPEMALKQYNRIANAILSLDNLPNRFEFFDNESERSWGMRRMVVDNYLVCYIVDLHDVIITDVLYSASNIHEKLSKKRI